MSVPISIRLDDDVRRELEGQARSRGIGLATLFRERAVQAARDTRRARIRAASGAVGRHVDGSPDARAFYDGWGTPDVDAG